jgi:prepilin-type N-terminal cleavage/methylation domain-containing protein
MHRTQGHDQAGFSLIELMVALAVGFMLLGIVYNIFLTSLGNFDRVEETTRVSRAGGQAMHVMTRYMREAQAIEWAGDNDITLRADWNDDGMQEEHRYYVDAQGRLRVLRTDLQTGDTTEITLAENVVNDSTEPIFRYFRINDAGDLVECVADDIGGGVMANGDRNRGTDLLQIEVFLDLDETTAPEAYRAATDLYLRNDLGG